MARRSNAGSNSKLETDTVVIEDKPKYNKVEYRKVRLLFPAKVKRVGAVSGKTYVWNEAGSVLKVRLEDVSQLLKSKIGEGTCCGGGSAISSIFEVV